MGTPNSQRSAGRLLAAGAAGLALATAALALAATPAGATPAAGPHINPYSPAYHHPYRHGVTPTLEVHAQMEAHRVTPQAANDLNYGRRGDGIGVRTVTRKRALA